MQRAANPVAYYPATLQVTTHVDAMCCQRVYLFVLDTPEQDDVVIADGRGTNLPGLEIR
jgi:hypothetical protein